MKTDIKATGKPGKTHVTFKVKVAPFEYSNKISTI